jgi:uncharacterized protein (UPF0276 family)
MINLPHLGHGIGLRTQHYRQLVAGEGRVDWLEAITENFLEPGGNPRRVLRAVRERCPVVLHGVSLSIGSSDSLDDRYLARVAALAREIEPAWISDHLCWGGVDGIVAHDLLPLPFDEATLRHVVERVRRVQDALGRQILLENVSSYLTFEQSTLAEWEFLAAVAERADCGILLDVNNVYVNAHNHGFDPARYFAGLDGRRIGQYHLAGHDDTGTLLLDTHDNPVSEPVWALFADVVRRFGPRATLVEWDEHVPSLERVLHESDRAAAVEHRTLQREAAHG